MRARTAFVAPFLVLAALAATPAAAQLPADMTRQGLPSLAPLVRQVGPAVVNIAIKGRVAVRQNPLFQDPEVRRFFGIPDQPQQREREFQAAGSGVIIDARAGYIVTNAHVVERADEITVTLSDGRRLRGTRVGADPETDIALIKVPPERLTAVPLGNSDRLEVGDFVLAIGNPFGIGQTVTSGIVSGMRRSGLGIENYEDFIQTDASINPGNSGGPLITLRGELVGINTAIVGPSGGSVGIGFAIPINMVRAVTDQLARSGSVRRGQIGVQLQDLTPDVAEAMKTDQAFGVVIARVEPNSPAQRAGFRAQDIVVGMDGVPIRNGAELRNRVALMQVGDSVTFDVRRDGRPVTLRATIGPRTEQPGRAAQPAPRRRQPQQQQRNNDNDG